MFYVNYILIKLEEKKSSPVAQPWLAACVVVQEVPPHSFLQLRVPAGGLHLPALWDGEVLADKCMGSHECEKCYDEDKYRIPGDQEQVSTSLTQAGDGR